MCQRVEQTEVILEEARRMKRPCGYREYERFKARLEILELTAGEDERAVRELCRLLEV